MYPARLETNRVRKGSIQRAVHRSGSAEKVLEFATGTHTLSLGAEKAEADVQTVAAGILQYLRGMDGAKTEPEIGEAVEGKTGVT